VGRVCLGRSRIALLGSTVLGSFISEAIDGLPVRDGVAGGVGRLAGMMCLFLGWDGRGQGEVW